MTTQAALRQRYCPPLDEALLFAIASDYDLQNDNQREQLEQELDALKASAVIEQQLELAPPIHDDVASNIQNLAADSRQQKTRSDEDNVTSLTSGLTHLTTSEQESSTDYTDLSLPSGLENASPSDKEQWLKTLFPTIEPVQISETLTKCNSDIQRCVDELLNLSFINDDIDQNLISPPSVPKGIDGFLGEGNKKSKAKKKRHKQFDDDLYTSDSGISSGAITPNTNVWDKANQDVAFIVSRTSLSTAAVNSIYHQNNANLSKTIRSLVQAEAKQQSAFIEQNEILQLQAQELQMEAQGVSENDIFGALLLAKMLPSAAKDLIDKMNEQPVGFEFPKGKVVGLAQYAPVKLDGEDTKKENRRPGHVLADTGLLMEQAGVHSARADTAFDQASAAYRRGKSDKLMAGVAAYYSQIGREENRRRKELLNAAADAHAYQQSGGNVCDLHGVTVEQAIRIARDKVEQWWEDLGDAKYRSDGRGIGDGYRIITGVGTHSAQRIGRIGPAVSKTLMREGWKVNIQRGEVVVEGRVRR